MVPDLLLDVAARNLPGLREVPNQSDTDRTFTNEIVEAAYAGKCADLWTRRGRTKCR
jgi:hypothetical protein